jgi:hypothetical protein
VSIRSIFISVVALVLLGVAAVGCSREKRIEELHEAVDKFNAKYGEGVDLDDFSIELVNKGELLPFHQDQGIKELWCFDVVIPAFAEFGHPRFNAVGLHVGNLWQIEIPSEDNWLRFSCAGEYYYFTENLEIEMRSVQ